MYISLLACKSNGADSLKQVFNINNLDANINQLHVDINKYNVNIFISQVNTNK